MTIAMIESPQSLLRWVEECGFQVLHTFQLNDKYYVVHVTPCDSDHCGMIVLRHVGDRYLPTNFDGTVTVEMFEECERLSHGYQT